VALSVAQREAVRDIKAISERESDSRTLRQLVVARLSRLVYWDAVCICTVDPWTLLVTDEICYGIPPEMHAHAAHNEYLVDDLHKFATIARSGSGVAILGRAPRELRDSSSRLNTIMPLIDASHEIRAACSVDGQCWGAIAAFRTGAKPDFSSAEAALLHAVAAPLAAGLRRTAYRPGAGVGITPENTGPGVLVLGLHGETLVANDAAHQWLDELSPAHPPKAGGLPIAIHQVVARVRVGLGETGGAGPDHGYLNHRDLDRAPSWALGAYARLRARSGRWMTVHGSPASGSLVPGQGIAVVIEAAPASDIAQLLMLAYGLTPRERQVLQRVIAGNPSSAIAAALRVSANTVQDHLKSIFAKVGVRSRGQLVARVIGEHYAFGVTDN
jgi:DNA-binding CsgD family transcriptional regulator